MKVMIKNLIKTKDLIWLFHRLKKLCEPIEEIHEWYWSIEDRLKHNYYHFYNKYSRKQRNKLYTTLKETL